MGTNSVAIVGRLAKDPTRKGDDDNPRLHFTVAVDNGKDRNGNDREPDWIQVVVFGSYAQAIADHLGKGHLVAVTGAIKSRKYTDETTGEMHSYLNVVANSIEFLARPRSTRNGDTDSETQPDYDPAEEPFQTSAAPGAARHGPPHRRATARGARSDVVRPQLSGLDRTTGPGR